MMPSIVHEPIDQGARKGHMVAMRAAFLLLSSLLRLPR